MPPGGFFGWDGPDLELDGPPEGSDGGFWPVVGATGSVRSRVADSGRLGRVRGGGRRRDGRVMVGIGCHAFELMVWRPGVVLTDPDAVRAGSGTWVRLRFT